MTDHWRFVGRFVRRRVAALAIVIAALILIPQALGMAPLGVFWFALAGVLVAIFDPIESIR